MDQLSQFSVEVLALVVVLPLGGWILRDWWKTRIMRGNGKCEIGLPKDFRDRFAEQATNVRLLEQQSSEVKGQLHTLTIDTGEIAVKVGKLDGKMDLLLQRKERA